jgi:hypothetical protein
VREMAFGAESPLYYQDVKKTDRQDDNASTWAHSAGAMAYSAKLHPDCLGLVNYLFIFCELIDAYQNQKNISRWSYEQSSSLKCGGHFSKPPVTMKVIILLLSYDEELCLSTVGGWLFTIVCSQSGQSPGVNSQCSLSLTVRLNTR